MAFLSPDKISIAPSILNADFGHLAAQLHEAERTGVEAFHLDIMDGHFVPNISFGPDIVRRVNELTALPLDVHLMISDPDFYLERFIEAGADCLTVHLEACRNPDATIQKILDHDIAAGIAVSPDTPVEVLAPVIGRLDLVLIMSVHPGFGGQKFIPATIGKLQNLSVLLGDRRGEISVQVDGGLDSSTIPQVIQSGANLLVIGSAIFRHKDIASAVHTLREIIRTNELQS